MGFVDKLVLDGKRKRMEEELKEEKLPLFIWGRSEEHTSELQSRVI